MTVREKTQSRVSDSIITDHIIRSIKKTPEAIVSENEFPRKSKFTWAGKWGSLQLFYSKIN
jgi:hypothetical protein